MRAGFQPEYEVLEDDARALHGFGQDSKPLLARHVAQQLTLDGFPEARARVVRLAKRSPAVPRGGRNGQD